MTTKGTLRTCKKGHQYHKTSDCPTCPVCEAEKKPREGFLSLLPAPARRAMENEGITTLKKLSAYTEKEILALHGVGTTTIPILINALRKEKLSFRRS